MALALARAVSNTQVAATAGNSGNGTIADVELGTGYKIGAYKLVCVEPAADAGNFALYDPAGKFVGKVVVAVAFSGEIQFTVADGGNNFVAGDSFTIYVHGATMFGTSVYVPYAYNGSTGQPAGILYGEVSVPAYDADLNLGNVRAVMLARQAEVFAEAFEDATGADIATLAAMGILFR